MRVIRRMLRRQQRVAYFFICFFFLALAIPLARAYGRAVTLSLCAGFIVLLEIGYRRLVLIEARKRRRWWAKQRQGYGLRIYFLSFPGSGGSPCKFAVYQVRTAGTVGGCADLCWCNSPADQG